MTEPGLECVSCYGARQLQEAGDFERIADEHDYREKAVVVYKGMSLCRRHFNLIRAFPAEYPNVPLPAGMKIKAEEFARKRAAADRPPPGS